MAASSENIPRGVVFAISIIICLLLLWFGVKLLMYPFQDLGDPLLLALGIICTLTGIFLLSIHRTIGYIPVIIFVLIGIYSLIRAIGIIDDPLLARITGALAILSTPWVIILTWPSKKPAASS